jgi:hypothetical protein
MQFKFLFIYALTQQSILARSYGTDWRDSIPSRSKRFFSFPQDPDHAYDPIHLYLVPRSRMVELYLHSPVLLHGVALIN